MTYFPYKVVLTPEEAKKHLDAAVPIAEPLKQMADSLAPKPFDSALGLYLAMCAICVEYGWHPEDFFQFGKEHFPQRVVPTIIG